MDSTAHDRIPEIALGWHREGRGAALATVIETWGSAPRRVGSQLAISGAGDMAGSVSGGCVEGAVVAEAAEALADGRARVLTYGVSDDDAFSVGLACGGTIRVLVEPVGAALDEALLAGLVAARAARRPIAYIADLSGGAPRLEGAGAALVERFRGDRSGIEGERFIGIHNPPLRLFAVGAVHIAQALVPMARACGHDVTLIDPREAFGSAARFPGVAISHDWPDEALGAAALDARCSVVTLSHDPKIDDPALVAALRSDVFYIGSLGSTRTHAKRLDRLAGAGFDAAALARIHAPIGLPIGAQSPAEIALAIMAEITRVLRSGA
ncbi:MAG: XdhC family protein [Rhodobacteraceae bacterium]|nr:XdhC family protein [Paracoccaceae bacterium]